MAHSLQSVSKARLLHQAGFGEVYTRYQDVEDFKAKRGPNKSQRVVNGWKNANLT